MTTTCDQVTAELSELVDGDRDAIGRHADHLAGCDACRDARHDAAQLAALVADAGVDHLAPGDLADRVLAALDRDPARLAHDAPARSDHAATAPSPRDIDHRDIDRAAGRGALRDGHDGRAAVPSALATLDRDPVGLAHDAPARSDHAATAPSPRDIDHRDIDRTAGPGALHDGRAAVPSALATNGVAGPHAEVGAARADDRDRSATRPANPRADRGTGDAQAGREDHHPAAPPRTVTRRGGQAQAPASTAPGRRIPRRFLATLAAGAALAAAIAGLIVRRAANEPEMTAVATGPIGQVARIERAGAPGTGTGVMIREGAGWRALSSDESVPAGAELRTDERTRTSLALSDGTRLVLDHQTAIGFQPDDARRIRLTAGRLAADIAEVAGRPAAILTPSGRIDVAASPAATTPGSGTTGTASATTRTGSTRFSVTATGDLTSVQVTHNAVVLANQRGERDDVRAGEEGMIERGALAVSAATGLARDAAWSELAPPGVTPGATPDEVTSGLGALRAYKPGESRDRDWKLALASHDVKIRVVGPIARTEVAETFRNDSATTLEGVYQFPLPPDAQIDGLALDVNGGFVDGAFVDKERGARIWRGVIDRATPKPARRPSQEIIWVEGRWRDPALLDWKRGGRFELRVYPIPAHGARTIKLAYTQVVTPRGSWRQYSYPLPHSRDGSTVADQFTVDVELRGAAPGAVRTAGYELAADPSRPEVHALTLRQAGFVPRGDLVIAYRAERGDAELRAWTFAGGAAAAPDDKLAAKQRVGIDPKVVEAQRAIAADLRPTAVLALRPQLPRWRDGAPRDYLIVIDGSQSMVGERFTRATDLATALVEQMDRRDRFGVMVCDSECRSMDAGQMGQTNTGAGELRAPSLAAAGDAHVWLAGQEPAGASDIVAALRAAGQRLGRSADREPWILYVGDGFASTGFRRAGDIERAIAATPGPRIATIGIGSDADATVLQAAARGGGGSYLAWLPGERTTTAAAAALESTLGAALRDAQVVLPAGLTDVAPTVLPTLRAGEEVLIAARMTAVAEVAGDVIIRGQVAGQAFEQRYPLRLTASVAAGNGFVPRLWATLAIEQLERTGTSADRARIVALSQGHGVMSRETSLLVLESQAMFDAFGVDRRRPAATWTGEDALDEVASSGALALAGDDANAAGVVANKHGKAKDDDARAGAAAPASSVPSPSRPAPRGETRGGSADKAPSADARKARRGRDEWGRPGADWIQLRRVWVRVPSVTPYDAVNPAITKAIADAEAAFAASPDSREHHRALVQALSYAGELGRARDIAKRWLERDQLDPQALGYLADLLGRDGQRDRALRTLAGLVDLDADRVALHDRMVRAYEQVGRLAQACAHRIAIASLQTTPTATAGALRCLRALGRDRDAELILAALPDASRAAAEKAALVAPLPAPVTGDLVVKARWDGPADLDVALVTPDGTRVSWMGGRGDVVTGDVTARDREELAIKALRRGNYLIEISRAAFPAGSGAPGAAGAIRGSLDITALGARRSIPFELSSARAVVGRVSVRLEERFEELDGTQVQLYNGPDRRIVPDR